MKVLKGKKVALAVKQFNEINTAIKVLKKKLETNREYILKASNNESFEVDGYTVDIKHITSEVLDRQAVTELLGPDKLKQCLKSRLSTRLKIENKVL